MLAFNTDRSRLPGTARGAMHILQVHQLAKTEMEKIKRLRAMAKEALLEYQASLARGGEPVYPGWADDMLEVCEQAEAGIRLLYRQTQDSSTINLHS
jgi:hypothetical protein